MDTSGIGITMNLGCLQYIFLLDTSVFRSVAVHDRISRIVILIHLVLPSCVSITALRSSFSSLKTDMRILYFILLFRKFGTLFLHQMILYLLNLRWQHCIMQLQNSKYASFSFGNNKARSMVRG